VEVSADKAVQAIKEGEAGVWTVSCPGTTVTMLEAFQSLAALVIDEARLNGLTPAIHRTSETGISLIDKVTVQVP
jgi:hypothetical protein